MKSYSIGNVEIGTGRPKVGAWLMGSHSAELISEAKYFSASRGEFAEWHIEYFEPVVHLTEFVQMAEKIVHYLNGKPLIVSYREIATEGNSLYSKQDLAEIFKQLILSGWVNQLDFEVTLGKEFITRLTEFAHEHAVKVNLTDHFCEAETDRQALLERFWLMKSYQPDAMLLFTYPNSNFEVLELLAALEELHAQDLDIPYSGLACFDRGTISRIAGETFGSAVTYGAAMKVSIPGKIPVNDLYTILNLLHINGMH